MIVCELWFHVGGGGGGGGVERGYGDMTCYFRGLTATYNFCFNTPGGCYTVNVSLVNHTLFHSAVCS